MCLVRSKRWLLAVRSTRSKSSSCLKRSPMESASTLTLSTKPIVTFLGKTPNEQTPQAHSGGGNRMPRCSGLARCRGQANALARNLWPHRLLSWLRLPQRWAGRQEADATPDKAGGKRRKTQGIQHLGPVLRATQFFRIYAASEKW